VNLQIEEIGNDGGIASSKSCSQDHGLGKPGHEKLSAMNPNSFAWKDYMYKNRFPEAYSFLTNVLVNASIACMLALLI